MLKNTLLSLLKLTLPLALLCSKPVFAATLDHDEASAYANFIQNLVNKSTLTKKGALCIYGHDSVAKSLESGAGNVLIQDGSSDFHHRCKAIYISVDSVKNLKVRLGEMASHKILTISTYEEFVEDGGMIQVGMGRRDFELTVDVRLLHSAQIKLDTLSTNLIIN
ncbi:MAG: DUF4154 domain-containing protein [Proteobacteria bacterium]|nr:DUF4154 domain-containing protein [Pseudomonadota bacterium]